VNRDLAIAAPPLAVREALERQSAALADYSLEVFLEFDFLDHNILGGQLTGGHIVTYLAREADRMADELLASTDQPVPTPDRSRRWELSEGGNERPGAVMVDDIHESTLRLREAVASVADWSAVSEEVRGIPARRLLQLAVHLVDLGRRWDRLALEDAAAAASVLSDVLQPELSGYRLIVSDRTAALSWVREGDLVSVTGAPAALVAWASGRTTDLADLPSDIPTPPLRVWI
jgi:hypothetical protein